MAIIYVAIIVATAAIMAYVFVGVVLCIAGRSIGLLAFAFLMTPNEFEKAKNAVQKESFTPLKCVIRAPAELVWLEIRQQYQKIRKRVV